MLLSFFVPGGGGLFQATVGFKTAVFVSLT